MSESTRVIKRYANRKLYDTVSSSYITLEQIAELIRRGEEVVVVDKATDQDLTSVTLAQIIFEQEKQTRSFLPLAALRRVIQTGGESLSDLKHQISGSAERVGRVFRRDERADGSPAPGAAPSPGTLSDSGRAEKMRLVREWIETVQRTIDDWQKRVDSTLHQALDTISPFAPLHREVQALRARLAELEQTLAALKNEHEST